MKREPNTCVVGGGGVGGASFLPENSKICILATFSGMNFATPHLLLRTIQELRAGSEKRV